MSKLLWQLRCRYHQVRLYLALRRHGDSHLGALLAVHWLCLEPKPWHVAKAAILEVEARLKSFNRR